MSIFFYRNFYEKTVDESICFVGGYIFLPLKLQWDCSGRVYLFCGIVYVLSLTFQWDKQLKSISFYAEGYIYSNHWKFNETSSGRVHIFGGWVYPFFALKFQWEKQWMSISLLWMSISFFHWHFNEKKEDEYIFSGAWVYLLSALTCKKEDQLMGISSLWMNISLFSLKFQWMSTFLICG